MLQVRDLHAGYGATPILFGVSLEVREGEAVALLGKNGMGKTTLMKTLMGFLTPWRGVIEFDGRSLARLRPHEIARLGRIERADADRRGHRVPPFPQPAGGRRGGGSPQHPPPQSVRSLTAHRPSCKNSQPAAGRFL